MANKFSTIKERVSEMLELKGIPKESFYIKIGMTSASFRGAAKNRPLNSDAIENILSEIPDLSARWLITGQGHMTEESIPSTSETTEMNSVILNLSEALSEANKTISFLRRELEYERQKVGLRAGGANKEIIADAQTG